MDLEKETLKREAEEWHCVNQFLNKLSVPKQDENGREYSTIGRICELMKMSEPNNYPERKLSDDDFTESVLKIIK